MTPDKEIKFTFGSHPEKDAALRWKAAVTFPANSAPETQLPIAVEDGNGVPVKEGIFEWAGKKTPIKDGKGAISYGEFLAGKHEVALWLYRDGMKPVPGGLTFE